MLEKFKTIFQLCKEDEPSLEEPGSDYSNDELDLEDTNEVEDYQLWLLKTFDELWRYPTYKAMRNFNIFIRDVTTTYRTKVLKSLNGFIAPIGDCPELYEEMKW